MFRLVIAGLIFFIGSFASATEISPLTVLGDYEITSPIAEGVTNKVQLLADNKVVLIQVSCVDSACVPLLCGGQFILINEVLVSAMECEDESKFSQTILLKDTSIESLLAGQQTKVNSTTYGLGNAIPIFIKKVK